MTRPRPLQRCHFRKVAGQGFDGGFNHYAYSFAWFQDRLYVGTVRNVLAVMIMRWPIDFPESFQPVPVPENLQELDLRGQIWRFDLDRNRWERVHRSPLVEGIGGRRIPQSVAFRSLIVFQGESDPVPALYAVPTVGRFALQFSILRTIDGENFDLVPPAVVEGETTRYGSFRAIRPHKGWLFAAPSHVLSDPDSQELQGFVPEVTIRCTRDPLKGTWYTSCPPSFGDPTNIGVYEMLACGEYLYACTMNVRRGFQLWRTRADTDPPHDWERVLTDGAYRGQLNEIAISGAVLGEDLYIGTAIQNGGNDRISNVGPDAFEMIRVHPDKTWDLVVGQARLTPDGLKVPVSGYGPGFDDLCNGYCWQVCCHEGVLYTGSFNHFAFLRWTHRDFWSDTLRKLLDDDLVDTLIRYRGGADLWSSADGNNWQPVTVNGFDNPYNYGIRSLISTSRGLFVGTANPFGPLVGVKDDAGTRFEANPRGGLEIWHGTLDHRGAYGEPGQSAGSAWTADVLLETAQDDPRLREHLPPLVPHRDFGKVAAETVEAHSMQAEQATVECGWRANPILHLAVDDKDLIPPAATLAEEIDRFFPGTALRNAGYWADDPDGPGDAARRLLHTLCSLVPREDAHPASVASPALVLAHGADEVAGTLRDALGTRFCFENRLRGLPDHPLPLPAEADSCGLVLWIEGPDPSDRLEALREVRRVLRPGGAFVASELVRPDPDDPATPECTHADAQDDLEAAGLVNARVIDITNRGWRPFVLYSRYYVVTRALFQLVEADQVEAFLSALPGGGGPVSANLLLYAECPR